MYFVLEGDTTGQSSSGQSWTRAACEASKKAEEEIKKALAKP
jgi:hypothetical protein